MTQIIRIKVKPGSSKNEIAFNSEKNIYEVYVKALPENGKANSAALKLLMKKFNLPARIIKGKTSRNKLVILG